MESRGELRSAILRDRRNMLKVLVASAYVAPVVVSFSGDNLVRASSCPGLGDCGNNQACPDNKGKGTVTGG